MSAPPKKYWITLACVWILAASLAFAYLAYGNPMEFGTRKFWLIAQRRADALIAMAIVAVCQAMATVSFHTVTNNRILTPSIMGFESLYVAINTATIFFLGASGLNDARTVPTFLMQMAVMVGLSLVLYSWLLTNRKQNMHAMLLVGVVIGGGLGSLSTFMQRMLTPSEFDILTARLFGSVNNAESEYYPIAIPIVAIATTLLVLNARKLNVISLGADVSTNLGVNHKAHAIYTLVLVSLLMATTTALVGPMTFLGFLVATLAYQFADTYDHRYIFPMAVGLAFLVLIAAYFLMQHVFSAQGVVSIIIELVGGSVFLFVIMRKGRL
ncbi:iron chelate uptake ABC transporter family permease subunit [Corynebacterium accolens]|jgi:iron ABC superfamily ATP binding cassette transporter, permease protein|uniref:iron chelate uptake ABC transporter family permease subunit n=1 Tax=Corynebacterium accolens TaxID=38284 RepID=UPI0025437627|nr:iron chelate uptake ABC transporter family permease subunit [Corynebacterium accolens]MDK4332205.1 iron chelate uptake ABC transporter family permease subunit [Corynebacterium accolens]MDK4337281.1 iron chelate uptake ABC transporter family permease subunit [Corynebacterium accolens]MDK8470626.1 iron chelate uptake ABC transporter family permease subunit [Corynebacterium accolens]MDK8471601.1 iron chelate uptake ABC transporter family permease subunit [Corynebacterium accolens]MDK8498321.1 